MNYGLTQEDIYQIKKVLIAHPAVQEVIIFGSRAMDTFKPGSDIDMAIIGALTFEDLLQLHAELEKLGMLYKFDLQRIDAIKDKDLLGHINRVGKQFYNKGASASL